MSFQITEFSSIERLSSLADTEFCTAFKEVHPDLLNKLRSDAKDLHVPVIKVFEQFFKQINVNITDHAWREVLQNIVSALMYCFSQNLAEAKNVQCERNVNLLKSILLENINILNSFDVLITSLTAIQDISIETIPTVPRDTISVMLFTFEYCKTTDASLVSKEEVTEMFKTCYGLLCHYITFLNKLKINCQYETEFCSLVEVLEKMYEIGAIAISLDIRTMAELWKGFTQILKTYAAFLRNEFDVSKIIRFLVKQITEQITALCDNTDEKLLNLTAKIATFLLKIAVKLCECFADCFGDCSKDLFEFAFFLYKHSRCFATLSDMNINIVSKIDTQLLPGVDPLITVLINDRQFASYYLNLDLSRLKNVLDRAAFLLLLSLILRKLLSCSKEVLHLWINTDLSILHFCFRAISNHAKELCCDVTVNMPCLDATISQEVYLYDALLVNFSTLIVNEISYDKFSVVEDLLVSNLLDESPLVTLFVSDLWCILVRYGNSELCFQHTKFVVSLSNECRNPVHKVFLRSLIKRLFSFLSLNHQLKIMSILPLDDNFVSCYNTLALKFRAEISQKTISDNTNKMKSLQACLKQKFDAENYTKMIELTNVMCSFEPDNLSDHVTSSMIDFIVQAWKRLNGQSILRMNLRDFQTQIVTLAYLSTATSSLTSHLSSTHVLTILQSISDLIISESLYIKLCCLNVLKNLKNYQIESHLNEISNSLAASFSTLLQDSNAIVRQNALDIFTQFSHVTKYENIISLTISRDKTIAVNVAAYLQRNPSPLFKDKNLQQFLDILQTVTARSHIENRDSEDVDNQSSIKRIKLQDDFCNKISQLENGIEGLLDYMKSNQLSTQQREALQKILNGVEKMKKFC